MGIESTFLEELRKYIQSEKEHLSTERGHEEQRFIIYSYAFDKVHFHHVFLQTHKLF